MDRCHRRRWPSRVHLPGPVDAIAEALDQALTRVTLGVDLLGVLYCGDHAVGMGMLVSRGSALTAHWRTVLRLMVHPQHQGQGAGDLLLRGLRAAAADLNLQRLLLTVRGGENLEGFYHRHGYEEVGRHLAAIRVSDGEYRDEVAMVASLADLQR